MKTPRRSVQVHLAKTPTRADSVAIFEAIVGAAAQLAAKGMDHVTTNAIAQRAGVGVASVYRYFPSKEAVLNELSRRLQRGFLDALKVALDDDDLPVMEAVRRCVELLVVTPAATQPLRRTLIMEVPLGWHEKHLREVHEEAISVMVTWLRQRMDDPPDDLDARLFVTFGAALGIVQLAIVHDDRAPAQEQLVEQLTTLFAGFLSG